MPSTTSKFTPTEARGTALAEEVLATLLCLTKTEAEAMFGGSNNLRDLRAHVQRMREGRNLTTGQKTRRKR